MSSCYAVCDIDASMHREVLFIREPVLFCACTRIIHVRLDRGVSVPLCVGCNCARLSAVTRCVRPPPLAPVNCTAVVLMLTTATRANESRIAPYRVKFTNSVNFVIRVLLKKYNILVSGRRSEILDVIFTHFGTRWIHPCWRSMCGDRRSAAGKVTVGLALHWPCFILQ